MARRGGPSSAWSFTQGLGDLQESDLDELLWAFVFKTRMAKAPAQRKRRAGAQDEPVVAAPGPVDVSAEALAEVDKWSFPDFVLAIYVRNKAGFGPILMGASELPSASTRPTIPLLLAAVAAGIAVDWSAPHPHHQIKGMIDVVNARKEQWASDIETRGEEGMYVSARLVHVIRTGGKVTDGKIAVGRAVDPLVQLLRRQADIAPLVSMLRVTGTSIAKQREEAEALVGAAAARRAEHEQAAASAVLSDVERAHHVGAREESTKTCNDLESLLQGLQSLDLGMASGIKALGPRHPVVQALTAAQTSAEGHPALPATSTVVEEAREDPSPPRKLQELKEELAADVLNASHAYLDHTKVMPLGQLIPADKFWDAGSIMLQDLYFPVGMQRAEEAAVAEGGFGTVYCVRVQADEEVPRALKGFLVGAVRTGDSRTVVVADAAIELTISDMVAAIPNKGPHLVDVRRAGVVVVDLPADDQESGFSKVALGLVEMTRYASGVAIEALTDEEKKEAFLAILRALKVLHENGIIQRDVKVENLVKSYRPDGSFVFTLVDLGLAATLEGKGTMCKDHEMLCSAIRAAPETQRREDETTASDIFSAACTGVELLMGREGAFDEGDGIYESMRRELEGKPLEAVVAYLHVRVLAVSGREGDPRFLQLLAQMLSFDPRVRPSAVDCINVLKTIKRIFKYTDVTSAPRQE